MSRPRVVVGAIVVAAMVLAAARSSAAGTPQSRRSNGQTARKSEIWAVLDDKCTLRAPGSGLEGVLTQKLLEQDRRLMINASPTLSFRVIQGCLQDLERMGIKDIQVPGFVIRDGRLFQSFALSNSNAPSVILDQEHLAEMVKNAESPLNPRTRRVVPAAYQLFISESGEVVGVERQCGPKMPAVESELLKVKVTSPGRRGSESVPSALLIEITGPITM